MLPASTFEDEHDVDSCRQSTSYQLYECAITFGDRYMPVSCNLLRLSTSIAMAAMVEQVSLRVPCYVSSWVCPRMKLS